MALGQGVGDEAGRIWFLAYQARFTRGRRGDLVVAACLYVACRKKKYPYQLIDFSSALSNVS
jgi:transcription factor IIIB subunit 2